MTPLPVPAELHVVQFLVVLMFLLMLRSNYLHADSRLQDTHPIVKRTGEQFLWGWQATWLGWLLFYGWLTFDSWYLQNTKDVPMVLTQRLAALSDVMNCLASFGLFWCFFVPSVSPPGRPKRDLPFQKAVGFAWAAGVVVIALAAADRLRQPSLNDFGVAIVGLYTGLAMAFFVGRFDSHWMSVPRWMLTPLYGYALIQMVYPFLDHLPIDWAIFTYIFALILKIILFLVVSHLLHDGSFDHYLMAAEEGKLGPYIAQQAAASEASTG